MSPGPWACQFQVGLLFAPLGLGQGHSPWLLFLVLVSPLLRPGDTRVVSTAKSSMQRQAVEDHFQTSVVSSHRSMSRTNMFVTTLSPNFPVDSGGRTLQSEALPSQSPSSNMLRGGGQKDRMAGHTRRYKGRERWRRRWRSTRDKAETSRVIGELGQAEKGTPTHGPLCDLNSACSTGLILGFGPRRHFKPIHPFQGCGGPAS